MLPGRRSQRAACIALVAVLGPVPACMSRETTTRVVDVSTERLAQPTSDPPRLQVTVAPMPGAIELEVTRQTWCLTGDVRFVTREEWTRSEAAAGRWGGIIPLALVGVIAGATAFDEGEDQAERASVALVYSTAAFVVYYVPLRAESEERRRLPSSRTVGFQELRACGPAELFTNASVVVLLDGGERRQGSTGPNGVVRFDGVAAGSVRGIFINGGRVNPDSLP